MLGQLPGAGCAERYQQTLGAQIDAPTLATAYASPLPERL